MMEVLSLVNFDNLARVDYLQRSFKSFYIYNEVQRHIVIDGSKYMGKQKDIYDELGIEYYHMPTSFSQRLKFGVALLKQDYFVFLPDDYEWIFSLPIEQAIAESRENNIKELKFVCPPMQWFSMQNPSIEDWYDENYTLQKIHVPTQSGNILKRFLWNIHTKLTNGETLVRNGNLLIAERQMRRSFMQQFSLGCHLMETEFVAELCLNMPNDILSAGKVEKYIYKKLVFRTYLTAYFKMLTPAFHFIDLEVEGQDKIHIASTNLTESNRRYIKC